MRKILVPYDGSKSSLRALEYVVERMRRGEKLYTEVLFVQPLVVPVEFVSWEAVQAAMDSQREEALKNPRFVKLTKELKFKLHTQTGDPVDRIATFVRKKHCKEVVMGTRGMGRLKGLIMGSVSTKIVQLVDVPVTLVK
jgi:nucleotide-binding universal stress UspA family protein